MKIRNKAKKISYLKTEISKNSNKKKKEEKMLLKSILKRGFKHVPLVIPELTYDYGELEPYISATITRTHLHLHHHVFIGQYNQLMEEFTNKSESSQPFKADEFQHITERLKFYNGVHTNHTLWWEFLANPNKEGGVLPSEGSQFRKAINAQFGSIESMIQKFNKKALGVQGSGWGWLAFNPENQTLTLETSQDQGTMVERDLVPLMGVDVWEHAYYLDYENQRNKFLDNIWNVVNWKIVENRYNKAVGK